jgi:hypothetical protein
VDTTTAIAHRLRRAQALALRAELAMTIAQVLLWVSLIGLVVALAAWARRRLTHSELRRDAAAPTSPAAERSTPEADGEAPPGQR